jgi:hypothetical protein
MVGEPVTITGKQRNLLYPMTLDFLGAGSDAVHAASDGPRPEPACEPRRDFRVRHTLRRNCCIGASPRISASKFCPPCFLADGMGAASVRAGGLLSLVPPPHSLP